MLDAAARHVGDRQYRYWNIRRSSVGSERAAVREPVPSLVDDLVGAVGLVDVDDIDLFALFQKDAALPSDLVGRAAIVEARQRAFIRLPPAWTEPAILGHPVYLVHGAARPPPDS